MESALQQRHVHILAIIGVLVCVAVVGGVGGTYLANRNASAPIDPSPGVGLDPTPATTPEVSESVEPSPSPSKLIDRRYRLDLELYDVLSRSVTLVSADVDGGNLRLNVRYRNDSLLDWQLACPITGVTNIHR